SQAMLHIHEALGLTETARGAKHPIALEHRILLGSVKDVGMSDCPGCLREMQRVQDGLSELGLARHPNYCNAIYKEAFACLSEACRIRDTSAPEGDFSWRLMESAQSRMQKAVDAYCALPQGEKIGDCVGALLRLHGLHYYTNYTRISHDDAQKLLARVERLIMKNGGAVHPSFARLPKEQSLFSRWHGDHERAVPLAEENLKRFVDKWGANDPWEYREALDNTAGTMVAAGRYERARECVEESWRVTYGMYQHDGPGQSGSARLTMLSDVFLSLSNLLSVAYCQDDLVSVYDKVLALKGRTSGFQIADRLAHEHPELAERLDEVRLARRSLNEIAFSENRDELDWTERLLKATQDKEIAENRLAVETRPMISKHADPSQDDITWPEFH